MIGAGAWTGATVGWIISIGADIWIGIGGAEGVGIAGFWFPPHFFQRQTPIRKMTKAVMIIAAGDVNVQ